MAQTPSSGYSLCQSDGLLCIRQYINTYGEFEIDYTNSINDYIAITRPNSIIGVIRSYDHTDGLRCFSNAGAPCTASPNSTQLPESVPVAITLDVVPLASELSAENADGTPKFPIPGAISQTNGIYTQFGVHSMNMQTCAQTLEYEESHLVYATYVSGVQFGGDVGTQDAVVIDEYELGSTASQNHVERYFYVHGYGRVREASSKYDVNTGYFDLPESGNSIRNTISAEDVAPYGNSCPQGSYLPM